MKVNSKEEFDKSNVFGLGDANAAFAEYFIGNSYLNPLTNPKECAVSLANVTFEPGCRNNWKGILLSLALRQMQTLWQRISRLWWIPIILSCTPPTNTPVPSSRA